MPESQAHESQTPESQTHESQTPESQVLETHTATLFFVGNRVYKVKKPLAFGFADFSTYAARRAACADEVALNRRLAPDVYLGVDTVLDPSGSPCESMVVMRRMPVERRLSSVVRGAGADVADGLRSIARTLAAFHARCETSPEIAESGSAASLRRLWATNLDQMRPFAPGYLDPDLLDELGELSERYLAGREPLLRERQVRGLIRDGHGDLLADDIYCLPDGPRILDCLEFDRSLRVGDVLGDVAFLAMDLERLGRADLARVLLDEYARFSGEHHPRSLEHLYVAYRAAVRSKVSCIRAEQVGEAGSPAEGSHVTEARALAALARRHLRAGRMRLLLVGGLPGTGKSAVADGLASTDRSWTLLRSDVVRKEAVGATAPTPAAFGEGQYTPDARHRTYDELLRLARRCLDRGENVILDASWTSRRDRAAAVRLAEDTGSELLALRCDAPQAVALDRITRRHQNASDASDADAAVALAMARTADPWPEATTLDTDAPLPDVIETARSLVDGRG